MTITKRGFRLISIKLGIALSIKCTICGKEAPGTETTYFCGDPFSGAMHDFCSECVKMDDAAFALAYALEISTRGKA